MIRPSPIRCLTVGDVGVSEMRDVHRSLDQVTKLDQAATSQIAVTERPQNDPQWIVLLQSRPGAIDQSDVESLHREFPLARLIEVAGVWSEAVTVKGPQLDGVYRVYWHEFPMRLAAAIWRHQAGGDGGWTFPRTASSSDLLMEPDGMDLSHLQFPSDSISVVAETRTDFESIEMIVSQFGCQSNWIQLNRQTTNNVPADHVLVWNCGPWNDKTDEQRRVLESAVPKFQRLLLLDFPRADHVGSTMKSGWFVLGRPFHRQDVVFAIVEASKPRPASNRL